ncbi:MAG: hypothetical protein KDA41_22610, partial [Planctomycetales bacterium]|nr:hypothetical protein [Planctomycetales bacterium]
MSIESNVSSMLAVEEFFADADPRFVETIRRVQSAKAIAGFADRWRRDPRPWARQQLAAYLQAPLNVPGHQPLVKRLFKHFEAAGDHEAMGWFAVAFDRLVRRVRKKFYRYDWQTRQSWQEEILRTPHIRLPAEVEYYRARHPHTGEKIVVAYGFNPQARLFSHRTRYHLRRRAWRYFRRLGFQRPEQYCAAIGGALALYHDDDLARGEDVLESWTLLHAAFGKHPALQFGATNVRLAAGRTLAELSPAPRFLSLWREPAALDALLELVSHATSRLVRTWSIDMARREHSQRLGELNVERVLALIDHEDA